MKIPWPLLAFLAGFFVNGAFYWPVPMEELNLPSSLPDTGLFLVAVMAVLLAVKAEVPVRIAVLAPGLSVPAAVIARIFHDAAAHPGSHGLAGIEVAIGIFYGCGAAGGAVLLAWGFSRVMLKWHGGAGAE